MPPRPREKGLSREIFPDLLCFQPVAVEHQIEWSGLFDAAGAAPRFADARRS